VIVLAALFALALAAPAPQPSCVAPDGTRVHLELALTDEEKALGLMFRDTLAEDRGMLFIFTSDDKLSFWMKNTFIPLDLIWLSPTGEVLGVQADTPPCKLDPCPTYTSPKPARAVLEVNGGFAVRHGIKEGVVLRFEDVKDYPVRGAR
jgi:uncharacterized membrane protein (UPF0127 family)